MMKRTRILLVLSSTEAILFLICLSALLYSIGIPRNFDGRVIDLRVYSNCSLPYVRVLLDADLRIFYREEYLLVQLAVLESDNGTDCNFRTLASSVELDRLDFAGWHTFGRKELLNAFEGPQHRRRRGIPENSCANEPNGVDIFSCYIEQRRSDFNTLLETAYSRLFPNLPDHDVYSVMHPPFEFSQAKGWHNYPYEPFEEVRTSTGVSAFTFSKHEYFNYNVEESKHLSIRFHSFLNRISLSEAIFRIKLSVSDQKQISPGIIPDDKLLLSRINRKIQLPESGDNVIEYRVVEDGEILEVSVTNMHLESVRKWILIILSVMLGGIFSGLIATGKALVLETRSCRT